MELIDLYNQIKNPIDDPKVIEKLITAYANSSKGLGGYYSRLTETTKKTYNKGQYYRDDADKFYAMLFNKWKNSIVAMTRDEFVELYKHGNYGQDFIKMRNYLKRVPDVSTMQEANDIFFGKKGDKELEEALDKYRWSALGSTSGWVHVCSRYLTAKKDKYPHIEHRLYLNTESLDTYKMITYFVEKCDQHHLPYYFKFDQYANRDDTIVIYSSSDTLTKYIEVLREIKKEHPELVFKTKEPPVLTGQIDGWIGYGSEPSRTPDGKNHSFNEIRADAIEPAIEQVTKKWIMDHRNMQIIYKGQKVTFQDYLAMKSTENLLNDLEHKFAYYEDNDKRVAQHTGKIYNPSSVINRLGYSLQDIRYPRFQQNLYNILRAQIGFNLSKVCNGSYKDMETVNIRVRNDKKISFTGYDLEKIIQQITPNIVKNDPNFVSSVQAQIKNTARQHGIDPDKYCFDLKTVERMKTMANKAQSPVRQKSDLKQKQNLNLDALDFQTIIQTINPTLLERKMKLPNGALIPAKQYIQKIVFPHLPSTGVVILASGGLMTVQHFIEEGVMYECQEKYNGDFPRYMAEKTRNNVGAVSIKYDNEKFEINPVEITNYINPTLLERKMKLPNGAVISAKQYIEEIFAPHIPSNGRIILSNGVDISVIQYIEELLLWEGQTKYNGDINQILFNTTRNNIGTISADPHKVQDELKNLRNKAKEISQTVSVGSGPKQ